MMNSRMPTQSTADCANASAPPCRWRALLLVPAALVLLVASSAAAAPTLVRWTHPDAASVSHFEVVFGLASGSYDSTVSVGKPPPAGSVFGATVDLPGGADVYLAIVAVDPQGRRSAPSGEHVYRPAVASSLSAPGRPVVDGAP